MRGPRHVQCERVGGNGLGLKPGGWGAACALRGDREEPLPPGVSLYGRAYTPTVAAPLQTEASVLLACLRYWVGLYPIQAGTKRPTGPEQVLKLLQERGNSCGGLELAAREHLTTTELLSHRSSSTPKGATG